jgi:PIN domain nuclease of toxin-antitoxin system
LTFILPKTSAPLLDTHVLIWLLQGNPRLGPKARKVIQTAAQHQQLCLSAISPWEIAMLVNKDRLTLDRDVGEWLHTALNIAKIRLEPVSVDIAVASTRLPGELHPDPADRLIVATARHLGATLITDDQALLAYAAKGHLKAQAAAH